MINVLLVDDHQIVIDGLKVLMTNEQDINLTAQALSGEEAIKMSLENDIDVILLDINLPDKNGFEVCKEVKKHKPEIKIIALTMHDEAGYISKMVKMGVDGYMLKNVGKEEMIKAIHTVFAGERYFNQEVTQKLLGSRQGQSKTKRKGFIQKLTRREKEILKLIIEELTTEEIAQKLFISPTTVISHRKSLLRKLDAKNTAGLVKNAYEFGLI